jgi:hypothetical protein
MAIVDVGVFMSLLALKRGGIRDVTTAVVVILGYLADAIRESATPALRVESVEPPVESWPNC